MMETQDYKQIKEVQSFKTILTDDLLGKHARECKPASVLCAHL